jgi:hypothetical protein
MRHTYNSLLLLAFCALTAATAAAEGASLYESLSRKSEVKIFVSEPKDISEKKALEPSMVKQAVEKALEGRKSIRFKVVPSEAEAELAVDAELKGFLFSETDPIDMLVGVGAAAMDAATQDHYGATEALFTVRDAKNTKVLWKGEVRGSVTDHTMTEPESRQKVSEKLAEQLMREAFGKKKR